MFGFLKSAAELVSDVVEVVAAPVEMAVDLADAALKPIVEVANGLIGEAGKQRTRSKALAFIVDKVRENAGNIQRLALMHAQCSDVDAVVAMIKEVYPHDFVVSDIGAVIGTHTGEGTLGVAFILNQ